MNLIDSPMLEFTEEMKWKNVGELQSSIVIMTAHFNSAYIAKAELIKAHSKEPDPIKQDGISILVLQLLAKMQVIEEKVHWLRERIKELKVGN